MATPRQPGPSLNDPSVMELVASHPGLCYDLQRGLLIDGVAVDGIANAVGTPTWVYSAAIMRRRYRALVTAMAAADLDVRLYYAAKANDSRAVLSLFAAEGAGADVVSGGELLKAIRSSIPPNQIVYSGVGKSEAELSFALQEGVGQINVESAEELEMLSALAAAQNRTATIVLRINPDVSANTNDKIATGRATDKFGIPYSDAVSLYAAAATLPGLRLIGLATHIGSQIVDIAPYEAAFRRMAELVGTLRERGHKVEVLDCGGGLGIAYKGNVEISITGLAAAMKRSFHHLDLRLALEPGRWLVGPAGLLLASVLLVKKRHVGEPFIILDAAMNDLVRPAMYDAWHGIVPTSASDALSPTQLFSVVGPICESGDTFARGRHLPLLASSSHVAVLDVGAYGAVMSSNYNARPRAAEVWVDKGSWCLIRQRQSVEEQWERERLPV